MSQGFSNIISATTGAAGNPPQISLVDSHFNDGVVGELANGSDGFGQAFSQSRYTTEQSRSGGKACRLAITGGTNGFGEWGGRWAHSAANRPGQGAEIWYRAAMFFPVGFDFTAPNSAEGLKFIRTHMSGPGGSNGGYWNMQIGTSGLIIASSAEGGSPPPRTLFYEKYGWPWDTIRNIGPSIQRGSWNLFEKYLKLHSEAGQGAIRCWHNESLIFEDYEIPTLGTPDTVVDEHMLLTYWNGNSPSSQHAYVDDLSITTVPPNNFDANGYPFIGAT